MRALPAHPRPSFRPFTKDDLDQSIPDRFEAQVRRYPNRIAVKSLRREVTYRGLNEAAGRVARAILASGATPGSPVAILLEHDVPVVAAIVGVLKAGRIVLVLDPASPPARTLEILDDSQAGLIVTNARNLPAARRLTSSHARLIDIDDTGPAAESRAPWSSVPPDCPAYLLYTSGSTGTPKGVVQTHRNILRSVMGYTNGYQISADDRVTLLASSGTAQAVSITFSALLNGAALCPWSIREDGLGGLAAWLVAEEISIYASAASVFRHLAGSLTGAERFPRLRLIRLGSEQVRRSDVEMYRRHFGRHCLFVSGLSSTETLNISQYFLDHDTELTGDVVPVGYAVDGMEILLLDETGAGVGPGVIGEIAVKSRYLSAGYWRRPDLTEAAFSLDGGDEWIYRTGDLGRRRADGCVEHVGRKDLRVKIRGFRIELEEIERTLARHPGLREAAVEARRDAAGEVRLVAYVVARGREPTVSELRRYLEIGLPEASVPSAFVFLDALPLTLSGKVNRRALASLDGRRPRLDTPLVPPRNRIEDELAAIWVEVLDVQPIGVHDSFLELGGHSLAATQVISRIRDAFRVELPLRDFLEGPTIAELAEGVEAARRSRQAIEFLGRVDRQVKIRGFRVEPEEVEAALHRHAGVREAVVIAREESSGDRRLVAHVVPAPGSPGTGSELRTFLKAIVPEYMVPSAFVLQPSLPRTANGKVDRAALPAPATARADTEDPLGVPLAPIEKTVAEIWTAVLGVQHVGAHDDFFALGGHSLSAMRVLARVRGVFGLDVPVRTLFEQPTLEGFAGALTDALPPAEGPPARG